MEEPEYREAVQLLAVLDREEAIMTALQVAVDNGAAHTSSVRGAANIDGSPCLKILLGDVLVLEAAIAETAEVKLTLSRARIQGKLFRHRSVNTALAVCHADPRFDQ